MRSPCAYSADLCGVNSIAMTLLDVLGGLDHLQICTAYKYRGEILPYFRADAETLAEVEPIYETHPGWRGDAAKCTSFDQLPREAQQYVKRIEHLVGVPIKMVSVGPERSATLMREDSKTPVEPTAGKPIRSTSPTHGCGHVAQFQY